MNETVKEYLPLILAGGAVLGGVILYRNSTPTQNLNYSVIQPPDNSAATAAAVDFAKAKINAEVAGIGVLGSIISNRDALQEAQNVDVFNAQTQIRLAEVNAQQQNAAVQAQAKVAKSQANTQLLGTIASIVLFAALNDRAHIELYSRFF